MRNELKYFIKAKYWIVVLPLILVAVVLGHFYFTDNPNLEERDRLFMDGMLQPYGTMDEVQALYDSLNAEVPDGMIVQRTERTEKLKLLYAYILENELPYDTFMLPEYEDNAHTPQAFLGNFYKVFSLFMVIASCWIGSMLLTRDFRLHTAKLVYTQGRSRSEILWQRYVIGLGSIALVSTLLLAIYACVGTYFNKNPMRTYIFFIGESVRAMNYPAFVFTLWGSAMLLIFCWFSSVYFLSAIARNGIAMSAGSLVFYILLLYVGGAPGFGVANLLVDMAQGGFLTWMTYHAVAFMPVGNVFYYAIYIGLTLVAMVVGSRVFSKCEIRA